MPITAKAAYTTWNGSVLHNPRLKSSYRFARRQSSIIPELPNRNTALPCCRGHSLPTNRWRQTGMRRKTVNHWPCPNNPRCMLEVGYLLCSSHLEQIVQNICRTQIQEAKFTKVLIQKKVTIGYCINNFYKAILVSRLEKKQRSEIRKKKNTYNEQHPLLFKRLDTDSSFVGINVENDEHKAGSHLKRNHSLPYT